VALTFPFKGRRNWKEYLDAAWLERWRCAWRVRCTGGTTKLGFDLHRAGSLWLWLMLLLFAWSSVGFNLNASVYRPVMALFLTMEPEVTTSGAVAEPAMSWQLAQDQADRLTAEIEGASRVKFLGAVAAFHFVEAHRYQYLYRSNLDFCDRGGDTWLEFDDRDGKLLRFSLPRGQFSGATASNWLAELHVAGVFGLPYRIVVSALGLAVVTLCLSGIYIWWVKRRARRRRI